MAAQALEPLFEGNQEPDTRDNAAGAVGRIISALGGSLPLPQVVPVLLGAPRTCFTAFTIMLAGHCVRAGQGICPHALHVW